MSAQSHAAMTTGIPSFSIAIESANLEHGGLEALRGCLASLAQQEIPPEEAREVILVDSGGVPAEDAAALREKFPWLTILPVQAEVGYIGMKMGAARRATAEVLVLCDADCRYQAGWLQNMLGPFGGRPEVEIVAGETSTPVRSPSELAIALLFIFPRFTGETRLAVSPIYFANNVAMRRAVLDRLPIPDAKLLHRGQNILHSMGVAALGSTIWRQPLARAWHLPPSVGEMLHRFSRLGRDSVNVRRLAREQPGPYRGEMAPDRMGGSRLQKLARRARTVLAEDSRYLLYLPLAVPVMAVLAAAFYAGRIAAHFPGRQAAQTEPVVGP